MNDIHRPFPAGKSFHEDSQGERDLVLSALRVAATKSRLETTFFDSTYTALRTKRIDCATALAHVRQQGLFDRLPPYFGGDR
jgi:hypothetical protein